MRKSHAHKSRMAGLVLALLPLTSCGKRDRTSNPHAQEGDRAFPVSKAEQSETGLSAGKSAARTVRDSMAAPDGDLERRVWDWWPNSCQPAGDTEEWSFDFTTDRRYGVIYVLFRPPGATKSQCRTSYTYFRVSAEKPVLNRYEECEGIGHHTLHNDGSLLIVTDAFGLRWRIITANDSRSSGLMLHYFDRWDAKAAPDGGFEINTHLADYSLRFENGRTRASLQRIHPEAALENTSQRSPRIHLPGRMSEEEARQYSVHLRELRRAYAKELEAVPESQTGRYVLRYVDAALPVLENPAQPYRQAEPVELAGLQQFINSMLPPKEE